MNSLDIPEGESRIRRPGSRKSPAAHRRTEDLPRLFTEFTQLETTKDQRHEGTGSGLALTKRLVELHGGRVWAESEGEKKGSTFTLWLPIAGVERGRGAR